MQVLTVKDRSSGLSVGYNHDDVRCTVSSDELPAQSFTDALDDLVPLVLTICGLPKGFDDKLKVIGLSLSPVKGDNFRVCIQAKKEMQEGSPLCINTPNRFLYPGAEENGGTSLALTDKQAVKVKRLCDEAVLFVKGLRAQRQLYLNLPNIGSDPIVDADFAEQPAAVNA